MNWALNKVFEISDLRRYIFSFLRKEPKVKCSECNSVLVWDKKINDFICIKLEVPFFYIKPGNYCLNCYSRKTQLNCLIN